MLENEEENLRGFTKALDVSRAKLLHLKNEDIYEIYKPIIHNLSNELHEALDLDPNLKDKLF